MGILRKPLKQNILHIRTFASLCHMYYKSSLQNTNISKPNSLPRPRRNLFTPLCSVSGSSSKYCSTLCSKRPAERGSKRKGWVLSKKKKDQVFKSFYFWCSPTASFHPAFMLFHIVFKGFYFILLCIELHFFLSSMLQTFSAFRMYFYFLNTIMHIP